MGHRPAKGGKILEGEDGKERGEKGLFQWVSSSYQVARVLELQLQHQMNSMKRQKDVAAKDELPRWVGADVLRRRVENNARKNEETEPMMETGQWCCPNISTSVIPFSPAFNLSQYQGLFQWVCSSHQVAKVLEFQLQHQSFQWIFRTDFL